MMFTWECVLKLTVLGQVLQSHIFWALSRKSPPKSPTPTRRNHQPVLSWSGLNTVRLGCQVLDSAMFSGVRLL